MPIENGAYPLWQGSMTSFSRSTQIGHSIDMTPLIDIVFQLLIFFVMTFRLTEQEADFAIKFPRESGGAPVAGSLPPLVLALVADDRGKLISLQWNQAPVANLQDVTERLRQLLGNQQLGGAPADLELELTCSPQLRYAEVIRALDAVTGMRARDGSVLPLVERVRISQLR